MVTVVTGGSGLLGSAICTRFLKNGVVINVDRAAYVNPISSDAYHYYKCDVSDSMAVKSVLRTITDEVGEIDTLINAIYPRNRSINSVGSGGKSDDLVKIFTENIKPFIIVCEEFIRMACQKSWSCNIINIASIYGTSLPRFEIYHDTEMTVPVDYCMGKSALITYSKYCAKKYLKTNIRINCVSPGGVANGQNAKFVRRYSEYCRNGMLSARDVAEACNYLASREASSITGQNIVLDDGFSL